MHLALSSSGTKLWRWWARRRKVAWLCRNLIRRCDRHIQFKFLHYGILANFLAEEQHSFQLQLDRSLGVSSSNWPVTQSEYQKTNDRENTWLLEKKNL